MSGNNGNEWNKFLNGGTSYYNFSYKNASDTVKDASLTPTSPITIASTPVAVGAKNVTIRNKNNKTKKDILPTFKTKSLKGGFRRRRTHRRRA